MKIHLEQIKTNDKPHAWEKKSCFVDSGFVKTYDELVTGLVRRCTNGRSTYGSASHSRINAIIV